MSALGQQIEVSYLSGRGISDIEEAIQYLNVRLREKKEAVELAIQAQISPIDNDIAILENKTLDIKNEIARITEEFQSSLQRLNNELAQYDASLEALRTHRNAVYESITRQ